MITNMLVLKMYYMVNVTIFHSIWMFFHILCDIVSMFDKHYNNIWADFWLVST